MEPLGKVAGTGASIVGAFSTLIGAILGTITGLRYDGTLLPLVEGFILWVGISLVIIFYTESRQKLQ